MSDIPPNMPPNRDQLLEILDEQVETPGDFQRRVDALTALLNLNAENFKNLESIDGLRILESALYVAGEAKPSDEQLIFLASVSKFSFSKLFEQLTSQQEVQELLVSKEVLLEAIRRGQAENAFRLGSFSNLKEQFSPNIELEQYAEMLPDTLIVTVKDLITLTIGLSCNVSAAVIKEWCADQLGSPEALYTAMKRLLPHYGITKSTENNKHWIQSDSNTGFLSEMVNFQHESILSLLEEESDVINAMTNNEEIFGMDFTNSPLGLQLQRKGYKIIEKTGSYEDGVNWVEALAKRGLPFHAPFLSVITIIPPEGQDLPSLTFGYYEAYQLDLPASILEEEMALNDETFTAQFPDTDNDEVYKKQVEKLNPKEQARFRGKLEEIAQNLLQERGYSF
jgi:hypothetical protein